MKILVVFMIIWITSTSAGWGRPESIRVRILSKFHPQKIWVTDTRSFNVFAIRVEHHRLIVNSQPKEEFVLSRSSEQQATIWSISGKDWKRSYTGELEFAVTDNEILVINQLAMEDYVLGVLAAEMAVAPLEALKAQAVLARTLGYYKALHSDSSGTNREIAYDLLDLTTDQAYAGHSNSSKLLRAVRETKGVILSRNRQPIYPFYHSTCGHVFYTPDQIWHASPVTYLRTRTAETTVSGEGLCRDYPHYSWSREADLKEIQTIIREKTGYTVQKKFPQKRGLQIWLGQALRPMKLENFRLMINRVKGWNFIKSNDYDLTIREGKIHFKGHGLGHNLGLCQCEAMELAKKGYSYRTILLTYFKEVEID